MLCDQLKPTVLEFEKMAQNIDNYWLRQINFIWLNCLENIYSWKSSVYFNLWMLQHVCGLQLKTLEEFGEDDKNLNEVFKRSFCLQQRGLRQTAISPKPMLSQKIYNMLWKEDKERILMMVQHFTQLLWYGCNRRFGDQHWISSIFSSVTSSRTSSKAALDLSSTWTAQHHMDDFGP